MSAFYERVADNFVPPKCMKHAYFDAARRESVYVLWPFNYVVELAWLLNCWWCRYTRRRSWIDRLVWEKVEREVTMNNSLYKSPICGGPTNYSSINYQPQPCLHCSATLKPADQQHGIRLSDRVGSLIHGFDAPEHRESVRQLRREVRAMEIQLEAVLEEAQGTKPHQKWWEVLEETE